MTDFLLTIVLLGLATATVSVTVAQSLIFKPFRSWVVQLRPAKPDGEFWFGGGLVTCPYCFGHWVAALFVTGMLSYVNVNTWLVSWLAVTAVSAVVSGLIGKLYE